MRRELKQIRAAYEARIGLLKTIAHTLETELSGILAGVPHIDRISFRTKSITSFIEKAQVLEDAGPKYGHPLEEIEDQIAGRVLVFYRTDIAAVLKALEGKWRKAEQEHRRAAVTSQFEYETTHRICVITPDMCPPDWADVEDPPTTFELQIRTLAQHAWSEPQHAFYKNRGGLREGSQRKLYWAAASAWGIDSIWEELQDELSQLHESTNP